MKGARAAHCAIWLAFQGGPASDIRQAIADTCGYDLSRGVGEIRPGRYFNETCQKTVPGAITRALEFSSFEDAVRNAIPLGGSADVLAAIAGPIAGVRRGIPQDFLNTA